jgi:hypothetical protein
VLLLWGGGLLFIKRPVTDQVSHVSHVSEPTSARLADQVSHVSHVSEPTSARLADQVSHVSGPTRAVERAHVSDPSKSTREPRAKRHVSRASQVSNAHVRQVRKGT